jgi:hypothetical protein
VAGRASAALGLLVVVAAGCASPGDGAASASALVGCYQFERGTDARVLGLPWGVELRMDALEGWGNLPDAWVALTRVTAEETADHPLAYWALADGDSVRVGHPGGGALDLVLAPVGQDLIGQGRSVGDAVSPGQRLGPSEPRPVVARRVVCGVA